MNQAQERFFRACPQHRVELVPNSLTCPKGNHPVGKFLTIDRQKQVLVGESDI